MTKLCITAKCSDMFSANVYENNKFKGTYTGYVPKFFPGRHFGDYVQLDIDVATGQILNWNPPSESDLEALIPPDGKH